MLFTQVISRVVHPDDRRSLRALELMTYATWTLFPIIQLLREFQLIDTVTQFMLMTGADYRAKMTYSTMLVFQLLAHQRRRRADASGRASLHGRFGGFALLAARGADAGEGQDRGGERLAAAPRVRGRTSRTSYEPH